MEGTLLEALKEKADRGLRQSLRKLRPEEAAVLALLQKRLATESKRSNLHQVLKQSLRTAGKSPQDAETEMKTAGRLRTGRRSSNRPASAGPRERSRTSISRYP
jgi:DNA topoisomerase-1